MKLLGPLVYEGAKTFTVPAGSWTDLCSVPREPLPPIGPHNINQRYFTTTCMARIVSRAVMLTGSSVAC